MEMSLSWKQIISFSQKEKKRGSDVSFVYLSCSERLKGSLFHFMRLEIAKLQ